MFFIFTTRNTAANPCWLVNYGVGNAADFEGVPVQVCIPQMLPRVFRPYGILLQQVGPCEEITHFAVRNKVALTMESLKPLCTMLGARLKRTAKKRFTRKSYVDGLLSTLFPDNKDLQAELAAFYLTKGGQEEGGTGDIDETLALALETADGRHHAYQ